MVSRNRHARSAIRGGFAALVVTITLLSAIAASPAPAVMRTGSTPWPGGTWQPDAAKYGMAVEANVAVPMDDGATLVANIGYPTDPATGARAAGTFPVLLTQAPYVSSQQPTAFFVNRGYIHAVVQVRGTGDTTGPGGALVASDMFGPRQVQDGVALVDWAAKLPASNGKIGLYGCSQLGINQIFTAAAVGPDSPIKAIVPACASNGYETYFAGGVPSQIAGLFGSFSTAGLSGPKNAVLNDANGKAQRDDMLGGGPKAYNGDYWQERTTYTVLPDIVENKIPALLWSGWIPTDGPGSLYEYAILQNAWAGRPPFGPMSPKQKTTGRYQVVIGPWMHGQGLDESIQLEWYDTWLKDVDTGMADTRTPMHLYELQSKRWVNASTFPLTDDYATLHLGSNRKLSSAPPKTAGSAPLQWGEPSTAGTTLSFDAAPLTKDQVVAGPVAATLYAKSSNRNLNLIATLNDVGSDGTVTEIATGNLVGSLRAINKKNTWVDKDGATIHPDHPYRADDYAAPNSLQRYDIQLTPSVFAVPAGHHLQLVVSTQPPASKCASLLSALTIPLPCIPSTPQKESLPGTYEVVWSKASPSAINVPLLAPADLPGAESGTTETSRGQVVPLGWSS